MKQKGFTLMELMIAAAIVAILAAIAIPSYTAYVRRASRTDATKTLALDAQALERCYSQNFLYTGCAGATAGVPTPSEQGKYTVTISVPDPTPGAPAASYLIQAVPRTPAQQADAACQLFTLNTANKQFASDSTATANTQTCWGST